LASARARYPVLAFPGSTALLVEHETRSVVLVDSSVLLRRIELLRTYLRKDIVFVNRYETQLHRWNAFLDIYVALHLALLPGSKAKAFTLRCMRFANSLRCFLKTILDRPEEAFVLNASFAPIAIGATAVKISTAEAPGPAYAEASAGRRRGRDNLV